MEDRWLEKEQETESSVWTQRGKENVERMENSLETYTLPFVK